MALCGALLIGVLPASAQEEAAPERVTVQVQVLDAFSREPVPDVQVELLGLEVTLYADYTGTFTLQNAQPGTYGMRLSAPGYEPNVGDFDIFASGSFITTLAPLNRAAAQTPGRMVGRLRDAETRRPLVGARVQIPGVYLEALTDDQGRFFFFAVPPGEHAVEFSNLGYANRVDTVQVRSELTSDLEVDMVVDAVDLQPIEVIVERRQLDLERNGFYERRRFTSGDFLDREFIDNRMATRTSDLFSMVNGVEFRAADPLSPNRRAIILRGGRRENCYPSIFVDGLLVHRAGDTPAELDQFLPPDLISGIEIYQGGASMPMEYGGSNSSCGAVVVWTQRGRPGGGVG